MDPESKKLLEANIALTKENNQMLHAMRRSMHIQRIVSTIYWVFIIGSAIGAYYIIQPYIEQIQGVYSGASDVLKGFGN